MINHARTLLLNSLASARPDSDFPGEEIVPTDFLPVPVTGAIKIFRDAMFGTDPDNLFLNYRLNQLLRAVHATDYESYLTDLDSRITYDLAGEDPFGSFVFGIEGRSLHVSAPVLSSSGVFIPSDALGRAEERWIVDITDVGGTTATVQNVRTQNTIVQNITLDNDLTSPIDLEGTGVTLQLTFSGVETKILVIARGRPSEDLAVLAARIESHVGHVEGELFGAAPVEPYVSFFGLWKYSYSLPDRMAGLVLALVYRMNELLAS